MQCILQGVLFNKECTLKKLILIGTLFLLGCSTPLPTPLTAQSAPTESQAPQATPVQAVEEQPALAPLSSLTAGPLTMVALGDSLTQGDGDDTGLGYPGRLLALVKAIRPDSTVTNLGQSGWNSDALINGDQGLESQLDRAVAELQAATANGLPAVAFVWIGSNDLWYLYEYGGDIDAQGNADDSTHFAANMDLIISRLRGTGAAVFVALLDDQSQRPVALKGEAFTSVTQDELAQMSVQVQRYNEIINEKAAQYGAGTVDFYNTDIFTNPATLYDDGNHPNQAGYDLITQKWLDALLPLLQ
jgi:lysophospholipase L1-like esterase